MRSLEVPPIALDRVWPLVAPWIARALEKGCSEHSLAFVRWHLWHNDMRLFLAWDDKAKKALGCYILEFAEGERGKCCHIFLASGVNFKTWRHLIEDIKTYARAQGCARLEAGGRFGWERLLARDGWTKLKVILEMRLDDA